MPLLEPESLSHGHYECRSLDETLPVFTDLLAVDVVRREVGAAVVQHPNTPWALVVHEGGPDAPVKPHANHYGFRVSAHTEIDAAAAYLQEHQAKYGLTLIDGPRGSHFAYSCTSTSRRQTIESALQPRAALHGRQSRPWRNLCRRSASRTRVVRSCRTTMQCVERRRATLLPEVWARHCGRGNISLHRAGRPCTSLLLRPGTDAGPVNRYPGCGRGRRTSRGHDALDARGLAYRTSATYRGAASVVRASTDANWWRSRLAGAESFALG